MPRLRLVARGVGRVIDALCTIFGWLSGVFILVMTFAVFIEVVMRYGFNRPTIWSMEITSLSLVLAGFFALPYVMKQGRHIRVDVLVGRLAEKPRISLEVVTLLGVIVFSGILLWHGQRLLLESLSAHELSAGRLQFPMWIPRSVIPMGTSLLILQTLKIQISLIERLCNRAIVEKVPIRPWSLQNPALLIPLYLAIIAIGIWAWQVNQLLSLAVLACAFLFGGVPVAFALGLAGAILLFHLYGAERGLVQTALVAFSSLDSFTLTAIPLFIFSATILSEGKLGEKLYQMAAVWVGRLPGGLAVGSVLACGLFGAVCGSSVAGTAAIGLIAVPAMISRGYDRRLAYGSVAAGGNLSSIIPPSLSMILFGSLTEVSVGKLFIGGIVPGVVEIILMSLLILWLCRGGRRYTPSPPSSWKEKVTSLKTSAWVLVIALTVLGGIYGGVFTPTEAAGVAVILSFLICILVFRSIGWQQVKNAILISAVTSGFLLAIIVGAKIFGHTIVYLRIPDTIITAITEAGFNRWVILVSIQLLMMVLGCFMEAVSILVIVIPVAFPVIVALGFDPLWFGILFTANMEVAMLTPPVGLNLFVIQGITQDKLSEVVWGALPFVFLLIFNLALLMAFPSLITWLPGTMTW